MSDVRTITTPYGDARLHVDRARRPVAALALGHGAGKGVEAPDLEVLADALPRQHISVFRIEQPWHVAGRKVAAAPGVLDIATVAVVNTIRVRSPIVLGGRSAGARVACRLAPRLGAVGCLALAFPLHPPGRPASSRLAELRSAGVPTLVIQGERDPFGLPDEFPDDLDLTPVPSADHSFRVPARGELTQEQALAVLVEAVVEWVTARVAGV